MSGNTTPPPAPPEPFPDSGGDDLTRSSTRQFGVFGLSIAVVASMLGGVGFARVGSSEMSRQLDEAETSEQQTIDRLADITSDLGEARDERDTAESEAAQLATLLEQSEEEMVALEATLEESSEAVATAEERADSAEETALAAMEKEFAPREDALEEQATVLAAFDAELDERDGRQDERKTEQDAREQELENWEDELDERAEDLAEEEASSGGGSSGGGSSGGGSSGGGSTSSSNDDDSDSGGGSSGSGCHPAYDPCIPPSPPDLDCGDVNGPIRVDQSIGDPHRFDADGDGVGCEGG